MRKFILPVLVSLAVATPAVANEARVEARGSVVFGSGVTEDAYGIAAGYDFDLGQSGFAGVEVSGDKIAADGYKVAFGFTGRAGIKASTGTRIYANGGYTTETCDGCETSWHAGAGFEQNLGSNIYGKLEYRHFFVRNSIPDFDAVAIGFGMRF